MDLNVYMNPDPERYLIRIQNLFYALYCDYFRMCLLSLLDPYSMNNSLVIVIVDVE